MKLICSFFAEGRPQPKQRARVTRRGAYTPKPTRDWERSVGWTAKAAMAGHGPPSGAAIRIDITAYYAPPKSWPAERRAAALQRAEYPGGADVDNIAKAVADGLQGVAYEDDRQVVALRVSKRYGDFQGAAVSVHEVGPPFDDARVPLPD